MIPSNFFLDCHNKQKSLNENTFFKMKLLSLHEISYA